MESFLIGRKEVRVGGLNIEEGRKKVEEKEQGKGGVEDNEEGRVEVVMEDGVVKKLVVHCNCGRCAEIKCIY